MQVRSIGLLFACLLVVGSVAAVAGGTVQTSEADIQITGVEYGGPGVVNTTAGTNKTYLWRSEPVRLSSTVGNDASGGVYQYCANARQPAPPSEEGVGDGQQSNATVLDCKVVSLKPNSTTNVSFDRLNPPNNASGKYDINLLLRSQPNGGDVLANNTTTVWYISKSGDVDNDGLVNADEVANNTSIEMADTDRDGLNDGPEIQTHNTDPLSADTDGDGLRDGLEVTIGTNPNSNIWPILLGIAAVLVVVLGGAAYRYGAFSSLGERSGTPAGTTGNGSRPGGGAASTDQTEDGDQPATAAPDTVVTDEDRILQLLAENDGRLMQSELVDQTGWSKSKVSRRLSALEEEGQVSKISLGRQNIVTLPGHEPEGTKSPLDE